jgi:endonuclease/exonuclease/phosphatase family metal-dependent hydrolase
LNADVAALQEVSFSDNSGGVSLSFMREETGMHVTPGLTFAKKDSDFGNLLLSKRPLDRIERIDLSVDDREPRGAVCGRLTMDDIHVKVITTHLGLRQYERRQQWRYLIRQNDWHSEEKVILMGDLNEWNPFGRTGRWIRSFFAPPAAPPTYPAWCPFFPLDRILVYPKSLRAVVGTHKSGLAKIASDHLPVVANIEL